MQSSIDSLGQFIINHLRDSAGDFIARAFDQQWKAPSLQHCQQALASMAPSNHDPLKKCMMAAIDHAIHDFLFSLKEREARGAGVALTVNHVDATQLSDGLHGELFGVDGWINRFSRYPGTLD